MTQASHLRTAARFGPALALALLLAAQAASAAPLQSAQLSAADAQLIGTLDQRGTLNLLYISGTDQVPTFLVSGDEVRWTEASTTGPTIQVPDPRGGDDIAFRLGDPVSGIAGQPPEEHVSTDATFAATESQAQFIVHVYGAQAATYRFRGGDCQLGSLETPSLTREGIAERKSGHPQNDPAQPPPTDFVQPSFSQAMVLTEALGPGTLTVKGSFIVEVWGVSGTMTDTSGSQDVRSGTWTTPVAPGAPDSNVYQEETVLLRMAVTDGDLRVVKNPTLRIQWAGPTSETIVSGTVGLTAAAGLQTFLDGSQSHIDAERHVLLGHSGLQAAPAGPRLQLALVGLDESGQPLRPEGVALDAPQSLLMGSLAVAGLAVAITALGFLAYRRWVHQPILADVERSLETGHYRRAARQAARILRRRPGLETALISRAIALSKAGRNRQVVREVAAHLETRNPSDGVLHYVLGVAYTDLQKPMEARAAFEEAVRRTPGLMPEVQNRLPMGSRIPAPSMKASGDVHGYV